MKRTYYNMDPWNRGGSWQERNSFIIYIFVCSDSKYKCARKCRNDTQYPEAPRQIAVHTDEVSAEFSSKIGGTVEVP